jgi:hypothetical protein
VSPSLSPPSLARVLFAALLRATSAAGRAPAWTICGPATALLVLATTACGQKPFDATPEGVAREFVSRMDAVRGESKDARAVFDLLSRPAQTNLSDRARRASAAAGKRIAPEQMIAPALFYPHFQPQKWSTRAQGIRAIVELQGIDPGTEHASIPCVLEDGHWRIDLVLPHLPPIERHERNDR